MKKGGQACLSCPGAPSQVPPPHRKGGVRGQQGSGGRGATPAAGNSSESTGSLAAVLGLLGRGPSPRGISGWRAPGSQG